MSNDINKDLDEVNSILFNMKKSLLNNPDNLALETNILVMEQEKKDLLQELEYANNHFSKAGFDVIKKHCIYECDECDESSCWIIGGINND